VETRATEIRGEVGTRKFDAAFQVRAVWAPAVAYEFGELVNPAIAMNAYAERFRAASVKRTWRASSNWRRSRGLVDSSR